MKKLSFAVLGFFFVVTALAMAADNDTQDITIEVVEISELAITEPGGGVSLTVNAATAGSEPDPVSNNGSSYAITVNKGANAKKITGEIDSAMPTDVTLTANLTAPIGGGDSNNAVSLGTAPSALVENIDQVAESGLTITYELSALVTAGLVSSQIRTVMLTIIDQ